MWCGYKDEINHLIIIWVRVTLLGFCCLTLNFLFSNVLWVIEWELFSQDRVFFRFTLVFDFFSFFFSFVVSLVAITVFFFGQYYIDDDKYQKGFSILLFLFVLSMFFLIFRPNMFSLLLGWDGLGLVSYLLVVYYIRFSRSTAGMITFLVNRVGDVFFLLSISLLTCTLSWDFFSLKEYTVLLSTVIVITFITKRAQVPFSSWLPAAIAAPTPVSSLVHSSTLVTAGIFLLVRFNITVNVSFRWLLSISLITILIAGIIANYEWDIKKLIAYSTLRQLGFIVISLRAQLIFFTFFHLLCHALFKASLFIVSGVMIHNLDSRQDFRNSTSFLQATPILGVRVLVCLLCLCGFPFLSGFFSKDLILDGISNNFLFFFFFMVAVGLTLSYSLRFSYYSIKIVGCVRNKLLIFYDSVFFVAFPVWILIATAILLGVFWVDFISFYLVFFSFFTGVWKVFYLVFFFSIFLSVYILFRFFSSFLFQKKYFFRSIWYLRWLVGFRSSVPFFNWGSFQRKVADQGWFEFRGPQGLSNSLIRVSYLTLRSSNYVFIVFFLPIFSVLLLLCW